MSRWPGKKRISKVPPVSVEIYDNVSERIGHVISQSEVEEGGKLLGCVIEHGNKITLQIKSYIDSGPKASKSTSHLHPDGHYQEAMFRVIESYYPNIEHLGTWHSHHCNGFNNLSERDIQGYIRSVNNPNYNLDYFFVILVTGIVQDNIQCRYFIFRRGKDDYIELHKSSVKYIHDSFPMESILQQTELFTVTSKNQPYYNEQKLLSPDKLHKHDRIENSLKLVRAKDHKWIIERFPEAYAYRSKDGNVFWQWPVKNCRNKLYFRYYHIKSLSKSLITSFMVEIGNKDDVIYSKEFKFDNNRFNSIEQFVKRMGKKRIKKLLATT